jgi:hypothetical protein
VVVACFVTAAVGRLAETGIKKIGIKSPTTGNGREPGYAKELKK